MSDTNVFLGTLDVTTDVPATLEVTLDDGERSQVLVTTTNAATEHTVPLRGGAWFVYRAERVASLYPTPI